MYAVGAYIYFGGRETGPRVCGVCSGCVRGREDRGNGAIHEAVLDTTILLDVVSPCYVVAHLCHVPSIQSCGIARVNVPTVECRASHPPHCHSLPAQPLCVAHVILCMANLHKTVCKAQVSRRRCASLKYREDGAQASSMGVTGDNYLTIYGYLTIYCLRVCAHSGPCGP